MKTAVIFSCCCIFFGCTDTSDQSYTIQSMRVVQPPVIDGRFDDPVWQQAKPVWLRENRTGVEVSDKRLTTQVMTCYDDSTLYIAFGCSDPDIWSDYTQRDQYLWQEEAVEVFIDVDDEPNTYVEIEVSPANVLFDSYITDPVNIDVPATAKFNLAGIKTAVHVDGTLNKRDDTDHSWSVELAIPFKDLITEKRENVTTDKPLKINFYRLDKNQGADPAGYAWSPTGGRFHKPSVFGLLIFK